MASSAHLLSPRVQDVTPAASLDAAALETLCSVSLEALLSVVMAPAITGSECPSTSVSTGTPSAAAPNGALGAPSALPVPPPLRPPAPEPAALAAAHERIAASWQYRATLSAPAAAALAAAGARRIASGGPAGVAAAARALVAARGLDDTFYVYDLGNTVRLMRAWRGALPRVHPFYAVKCNPEPAMLRLLAALGAGFDCASKAELEAVMALGVPPARIIFAHPCKRMSDIRYARERGVLFTTFDSESELTKLAAGHPDVGCVLRIRCDDPEAQVQLGLKYGADPGEAPHLLAAAAAAGLSVVGVSFHVGSGCKNLATFEAAIAAAREIFDLATAAGHPSMHLLDIGGGFTGRFDAHGNVVFGDIARAINTALAAHFPAGSGVRVISEPGRYFAETAATLFTPVYGVRDRPLPGGGVHKDYWLTDGLYGSFNCILYDGQNPQPRVLRSPLLPPAVTAADAGGEGGAGAGAGAGADGELPSTLWGPTCDSADYVYKDIQLPPLRTGDWLLFANSGAYTVAGACDFNGIEFTAPAKFYVCSDCAVDS